jgi:LysM repeat protein
VDNSAQYGDILQAIKDLGGAASQPLNGANPPAQGVKQPPSLGTVSVITVKARPGETWDSIAKRYYLDTAALKSWNADLTHRADLGSIDTTKQITPGSQVVVPWLNQ